MYVKVAKSLCLFAILLVISGCTLTLGKTSIHKEYNSFSDFYREYKSKKGEKCLALALNPSKDSKIYSILDPTLLFKALNEIERRTWVAAYDCGKDSMETAKQNALNECTASAIDCEITSKCRVFAINDEVIWNK